MSVAQAMECPRGTFCEEGSSIPQHCAADEICQGRGAPRMKCPPGTLRGVPSDMCEFGDRQAPLP